MRWDRMCKRFIILIFAISITLTLFVGCESNSRIQETTGINEVDGSYISEVDENKIPTNPLYYSIKEDYPEYFYLWPTVQLGMVIDNDLNNYNVYGNISIKTTKIVYSSGDKYISAEIVFPSEGYRDDVEKIGIYEDLGLEKLINGEWVPVPFKGNTDVHFNLLVESYKYYEVAPILGNGKTINKQLNTEYLYETLDAGQYRIILFLDDATQRYAEFDVE